MNDDLIRFLLTVGMQAQCKGCGKVIYWCVNIKTMKKSPYTEAGVNHFIDCDQSSKFRKKKGVLSGNRTS